MVINATVTELKNELVSEERVVKNHAHREEDKKLYEKTSDEAREFSELDTESMISFYLCSKLKSTDYKIPQYENLSKTMCL